MANGRGWSEDEQFPPLFLSSVGDVDVGNAHVCAETGASSMVECRHLAQCLDRLEREVLRGRGLEIGDNTWIGHEAMIVGGDALVRIGKDVDIAPRVNLITGTRAPLGLTGKAAGTGCSRPITIGDGAWIGAAATILGGVMIGQESIVAAGALVRSNVSAKTIVAGVPARLVSVKESRC